MRNLNFKKRFMRVLTLLLLSGKNIFLGFLGLSISTVTVVFILYRMKLHKTIVMISAIASVVGCGRGKEEKGFEVDASVNYADYYHIEALTKYKSKDQL